MDGAQAVSFDKEAKCVVYFTTVYNIQMTFLMSWTLFRNIREFLDDWLGDAQVSRESYAMETLKLGCPALWNNWNVLL